MAILLPVFDQVPYEVRRNQPASLNSLIIANFSEELQMNRTEGGKDRRTLAALLYLQVTSECE